MIPGDDLEPIITTNAIEESHLWGLLIDCKQKYPGLSDPVIMGYLIKRLSEMISEKKIGIYSYEAGRVYNTSEEYQVLQKHDALAVVNDARNWVCPDAEITIHHALWMCEEGFQ